MKKFTISAIYYLFAETQDKIFHLKILGKVSTAFGLQIHCQKEQKTHFYTRGQNLENIYTQTRNVYLKRIFSHLLCSEINCNI